MKKRPRRQSKNTREPRPVPSDPRAKANAEIELLHSKEELRRLTRDKELHALHALLHTHFPQADLQLLSKACLFLVKKGLSEEVRLHLQQILHARASQDDKTATRWEWSFLALALYQARGEEAALNYLPMLSHLDLEFFLGQPWIRSLVASWRAQGDKKKILHFFFGTPKRGNRSYALVTENMMRDAKIIAEVDRLRAETRDQLNEILQRVKDTLPHLGITEGMTVRNIQRIYRNRNSRGASARLTDLFKWP